MEPFVDDFLTSGVNISFLTSCKETGEKLKSPCLLLGKNYRIFCILMRLLKFEVRRFISVRLEFLGITL